MRATDLLLHGSRLALAPLSEDGIVASVGRRPKADTGTRRTRVPRAGHLWPNNKIYIAGSDNIGMCNGATGSDRLNIEISDILILVSRFGLGRRLTAGCLEQHNSR